MPTLTKFTPAEALDLQIDTAIERLRVAVVKARSSPGVADEAAQAVAGLNELYAANKSAFTAEHIRFANVLRGYLAERMEAHRPKTAHTKKAKRKGDKLDHCWRCRTPVDERFEAECPTCSEKAYKWRVCPVCSACGCQRAGTVLV
jgi:hypothetical protein